MCADPFNEIQWGQTNPKEIYQSEESSKEVIKEALNGFTNGSNPMTKPQEVNVNHVIDPIKATIQNLDLQYEQSTQKGSENTEKKNAFIEGMKKLGNFARSHPFLTIGFAIAIILAGTTAFFAIEGFLGHTTLTIFGAHPAIGGGLSFMTLYYCVYLINICRRAALKDDLEGRIKSHNEFTEKLMKSEKGDVEDLSQRVKEGIEKLNQELSSIEKNLQEAHSSIEEEYRDSQNTLANIKKNEKELLDLFILHGTKMPFKTREMVKNAVIAAGEVLKIGAQLQAPQFPSQDMIPLIPLFDPSKDAIIIPPLTTDTKDREEKQIAFKNKISALVKDVGQLLKKNPSSAVLISIGLGMCILSGLAIYLYFHGDPSAYFFGTMTLMTLTPMVIYGLSMIYEGYVNATNAALDASLKEIAKNKKLRENALDEERKRLRKIEEQASHTLQEFTHKWLEFVNLESLAIKENLKQLKEGGTRDVTVIDKLCEQTLNLLSPFFSDIPSPEIKRVIKTPFSGALIIGSSQNSN